MLYVMDPQTKLASFIATSKVVFGVVMAAIGWPLLSAWLNSVSRNKDIESWEKWALANPRLAAWVERSRALGFDLKKLLEIARREADRRAGQIPTDSLMKMHLPPQISGVLSDAEKRQKLVDFIVLLADGPAPAPEKPRETMPGDPPAASDVPTGTEKSAES